MNVLRWELYNSWVICSDDCLKHFTLYSVADLVNKTPSWLLLEALSHPAVNAPSFSRCHLKLSFQLNFDLYLLLPFYVLCKFFQSVFTNSLTTLILLLINTVIYFMHNIFCIQDLHGTTFLLAFPIGINVENTVVLIDVWLHSTHSSPNCIYFQELTLEIISAKTFGVKWVFVCYTDVGSASSVFLLVVSYCRNGHWQVTHSNHENPLLCPFITIAVKRSKYCTICSAVNFWPAT